MAKKSEDGLARLRSDFKNDEIGQLYIFYGEEDFLMMHYLSMLQKRIIPDGMEEFNYQRFEGKNLSLEQLAEAVELYPVMAERKLVVVDDYPVMKPVAADTPALESLLNDLPETVCLVFVYHSLPYKQEKKNAACAAALKRGTVVCFETPEKGELARWVARGFRACGKEADADVCEYLIFYSGTQMLSLRSEIEKISAYVPGNRITKRDIEAVAIRTLDTAIYQLTDELSAGRPEQALLRLRELLSMGYDPVMISASICRQVLRLYSAKLCLTERRGSGELVRLWKMRSSYPAEKLLTAARDFSAPALIQSLLVCGELDMQLKSAPGDREKMLEIALLRICVLLKEMKG